jgi:hypothetical protein
VDLGAVVKKALESARTSRWSHTQAPPFLSRRMSHY